MALDYTSASSYRGGREAWEAAGLPEAAFTVAVSGDYGKPKPAVVIQPDFLSETDSVLVCLLTTTLRDAPLYRLALTADAATGLREQSQIVVDKIMAVRRERCGEPIGQVDPATMAALGRLVAFVVGLAY